MIKAKNVYIGFGKAAKTLAFRQAQRGESVVVIEESDQMYGGTCINIACIPSKLLYELSDKPQVGGLKDNYKMAITKKRSVIGKLRYSNFHKLADQKTVKVLNGSASFIDQHTLNVKYLNGATEEVVGERIFINTGATSTIPDIPGLKESSRTVTSTDLLDQDHFPQSLAIIGGGYIGMEFATTYSQFGSKVTMINRNAEFMRGMDQDVSQAVKQNFDKAGIEVLQSAEVIRVQDQGSHAVLTVASDGSESQIMVDTILVATGRKPNIQGLNLEQAGIRYTEAGVAVDDHLRTNVQNIWAMGDVRGGAQFTFLSLDDYRIVYNQLYASGTKTTEEQVIIPKTIFLMPPLSQIGMSEREALDKKIEYRTGKVAVAGMPKAHILGHPNGFYKVLIDKEDHILGATIYAPEAHEIINIISLAMHANLPYQMLRDQIYSHPTMAEGLNDLFETIGMN